MTYHPPYSVALKRKGKGSFMKVTSASARHGKLIPAAFSQVSTPLQFGHHFLCHDALWLIEGGGTSAQKNSQGKGEATVVKAHVSYPTGHTRFNKQTGNFTLTLLTKNEKWI